MTAAEKGERLDRVLAQRLADLSRSRLKALILAGAVDDRRTHDPRSGPPRQRRRRDRASPCRRTRRREPEAEDIPLNIVYEDDELIVIDKPKGLVVHPAAGNPTGTLVNALIAHCGASLSGIGGVKRPGIVHRLDKDTTGADGGGQDRPRAPRAVGASSPTTAAPGRWSAAIWPSSGARRTARRARSTRRSTATPRRATSRRCRQGGREAITHWELLETYAGTDGKPVASLLACRLETGRTHQIRVHLAHIGHPLLGDAAYGPGFKTKAALLPPAARAKRSRPLAGRPCMPIYWASNTPKPASKSGASGRRPAGRSRAVAQHYTFADPATAAPPAG